MAKRKQGQYGRSGALLYNTWRAMRQRCSNRNHEHFQYYGGRGIAVCPAWHNFRTFLEWAVANNWRPGLTIERIDNMGGYTPRNCRFADKVEQNNNRRDNIWLQYMGYNFTLAQWARLLQLNYKTLASRVRRGWPAELALTAPAYSRIKELHFVN